jgi:hypothetical protein
VKEEALGSLPALLLLGCSGSAERPVRWST